MRSPSTFVRRIAARFDPRRGRAAHCSSCDRPHTAVAHMIAGPSVYLCDECIELAAKQLAPRKPAPDALACHFCRQRRARADVTSVGTVTVCADCLGLMTTILAEDAGPLTKS
jgi:hypothetical protein